MSGGFLRRSRELTGETPARLVAAPGTGYTDYKFGTIINLFTSADESGQRHLEYAPAFNWYVNAYGPPAIWAGEVSFRWGGLE